MGVSIFWVRPPLREMRAFFNGRNHPFDTMPRCQQNVKILSEKLTDFEKIDFEVLPPKITVAIPCRENLFISSPALVINGVVR